MKNRILFFCMVVFTATGAWAQRSGTPVEMDLLLQNANLVDVAAKKIDSGVDVLISGGKITAIGKNLPVDTPHTTMDLTGKYILPGLIDAHVHLANDPYEARESRIEQLQYLLRHGITSVRDAAGDARVLVELQRAVFTGEIEGPDITFAAFMAGPGYFKENDREAGMLVGLQTDSAPWMQRLSPGDDLDSAMVAAKSCGAAGIKVYAGYDGEYLRQMVTAARKYGLDIWGHATQFPARPSEVARSGVRVISHAYMLEWENVQGALSDNMFENYGKYYEAINRQQIDAREFFSQLKASDGIFDPTLYLCLVNGMEWSAKVVADAYREGVKICAGTDYINDLEREYPFLYDEIFMYVDQCGFDPFDAICSATLIAADAAGLPDKGILCVGKDADIVILGSDPTVNIRNLTDRESVLKKGKRFD